MSYDAECYCATNDGHLCVFCELESDSRLEKLAKNLAIGAALCRAYLLGMSACTCDVGPSGHEWHRYQYGAAWDGGVLRFYELRCPRWFFKCQRVRKSVSKSSPWFRWREDMREEWNAL